MPTSMITRATSAAPAPPSSRPTPWTATVTARISSTATPATPQKSPVSAPTIVSTESAAARPPRPLTSASATIRARSAWRPPASVSSTANTMLAIVMPATATNAEMPRASWAGSGATSSTAARGAIACRASSVFCAAMAPAADAIRIRPPAYAPWSSPRASARRAAAAEG